MKENGASAKRIRGGGGGVRNELLGNCWEAVVTANPRAQNFQDPKPLGEKSARPAARIHGIKQTCASSHLYTVCEEASLSESGAVLA